MRPKIDVLIPAYNAASTLESAVASIQHQTFGSIRILAVDDGSTDDTPCILARLAATDARLQVIRQPNRGIVAALNAGLAQCTADYVARHDADDIAAPDRFSVQVAWLETHPGCVAVSGAVRHIDQDGRFLGTVDRLGSPDAADPEWVPAREPYLVHPFLMARRAAMQGVGGYRHVVHAEDSDLYWRMQERGTLHNLDAVVGDYRLHAGSISGSSLRNGRIQAIESQRAALSALRRRAGRADLAFPAEAAMRYRAARALSEVLEIGRDGLSVEERKHLEVAVAGKLLELAAYRPYELELEDCRFIRSALDRHMRKLKAGNRKKLWKMRAGAAARLLHHGEIAKALALAPPRYYPATLLRLAVRVAMPLPQLLRLNGALGLPPRRVHLK